MRRIGVQRERSLTARNGLVEPSQSNERASSIRQRYRIIRLQCQGSIERNQRISRRVQLYEAYPQMNQRVAIARIHLQAPVAQLSSLQVFFTADVYDRQIVHDARTIRGKRKGLLVQALGGAQIAFLLTRQGLKEQTLGLLERIHGERNRLKCGKDSLYHPSHVHCNPATVVSASLIRKLQQAEQRLHSGDFPGAQSLCEQVLRAAPRNPEALYLLGIANLSMGRASAAVPAFERALANEPRNGAILENLGLAHLMTGHFAKAESVLRQAVQLPGAPASVFMRLGVAVLEQGRAAESVEPLRRAIALDPIDPDSHLNLGRALAGSGDAPAACEHFERAMALAPQSADPAFNLGVVAMQQGRLEEACHWLERALSRAPDAVDILINLGIVLQKRASFDEAVRCLNRALAIEPANATALTELGQTLALQGAVDQAREKYLAALRIKPDSSAAREGFASVCLALGRAGEAAPHLRALAASEPDNANAMAALARASYELGQMDEAEAAARRTLELNRTDAGTYATLANVHLVRGERERSIEILERGYEETGAGGLLGMLACQLRDICDWPRWRTVWEKLEPKLALEASLGSPFWLLCEPTSARQQLEYTRRWAAARFANIRPGPSAAPLPDYAGRRLRIGYLSSDFQEHAVAYLIAETLERHDRGRFEIFAYSYGPEDHGAMRERLRAACEHFVDIAWQPDDVAAERIRTDALDLLVDLKGYTMADRLSIMARRPCAVQATWLGYPGTTGASFIDYAIADPFLIPQDAEDAYSERIVRMPHCYQPNDRRREMTEPRTRAEYGLPEHAFVFCCFNQTYKITPELFATWMRLLHAVPGSVLWLLESNAVAKRNLLAAAQQEGIGVDRVIVAPKLPNAQHLARYRVADLALDTFPYTSHTTLSDALWCGCPSIALCGDTFAARVSGSLLTAGGMSEYITYSLAEHEQLALQLAGDPQRLEAARRHVARAREDSPLFDSVGFVRDLEDQYVRLIRDSDDHGVRK